MQIKKANAKSFKKTNVNSPSIFSLADLKPEKYSNHVVLNTFRTVLTIDNDDVDLIRIK